MKNRKNDLKFRRKQFKWKLIGFHTDSVCGKCGQKTKYLFYRYDAMCCISCNEWLEEACFDSDCPYCGGRPETPYEAYDLADMEAGSGERKKRWRRDNYQHKTDGMIRHNRRKNAAADRLVEREAR